MNAFRTIALFLILTSHLRAQYTQEPALHRPVVNVMYFHGTVRCQTCLTVEAFAETVMKNSFRHEMTEGIVNWQVIDYEMAQDTSSVRRYGIENQALVISKVLNGRELTWKRLPKVWKLVDDFPAFQKYLVQNVKEMLR